MRIFALIIVGIAMSFVPGEGVQTKKAKGRPNRVSTITSFSSSPKNVVRCDSPTSYEMCTTEDVSLAVVASDPDGDKLTYRYTVSGGTIIGKGSSVRWSLKDVANGRFQAQVVVTDGKGGETRSELSLIVADGSRRELLAPPCPTIEVNSKDSVPSRKHAVFTVVVLGGQKGISVTYRWSVPWGKIVKGQDTKQVEVEAADATQETITAKVQVGGYDPSCWTEASCSSKIVRR